MIRGNLFNLPAAPPPDDVIDELLRRGGFRLERIVSARQPTPEGLWYDQETDESVVSQLPFDPLQPSGLFSPGLRPVRLQGGHRLLQAVQSFPVADQLVVMMEERPAYDVQVVVPSFVRPIRGPFIVAGRSVPPRHGKWRGSAVGEPDGSAGPSHERGNRSPRKRPPGEAR